MMMLGLKILLCLATLIAVSVAQVLYEEDGKKVAGVIVAIISGLLGIWFCIMVALTNWNLFTIPKMLLFISGYIFCAYTKENKGWTQFGVAMAITIVAYIIATVFYILGWYCFKPNIKNAGIILPVFL